MKIEKTLPWFPSEEIVWILPVDELKDPDRNPGIVPPWFQNSRIKKDDTFGIE